MTTRWRATSYAIPCRSRAGGVTAELSCVQFVPFQLHVSASGEPPMPPNSSTRCRASSPTMPAHLRAGGETDGVASAQDSPSHSHVSVVRKPPVVLPLNSTVRPRVRSKASPWYCEPPGTPVAATCQRPSHSQVIPLLTSTSRERTESVTTRLPETGP